MQIYKLHKSKIDVTWARRIKGQNFKNADRETTFTKFINRAMRDVKEL